LRDTVDGCIPSDLGTGSTADLEDERRLLYVALTRAKDSLHLITPHRLFHARAHAWNGDRHVYASRTRFIPRSLLPLFDSVTWPIATDEPGQAAAERIRFDVGARMRTMWG
jgi:DNA helicase II / ATP-dependent DNA helicase PcrA